MRPFQFLLFILPFALLAQKARYIQENQPKHQEPYQLYYENGALKSEGFILKEVDANGKPKTYVDRYGNRTEFLYDSLNVDYFIDGSIKRWANYKKGKLNGEYKEFYESGIQHIKCFYVKDLYEGEWLEFHENGDLKAQCNMHKGLKNDTLYEYHENGKLKAVVIYKNGNREGDAKYYHSNGNLQLEASYEEDREVGVHTWYYSNGKKKSLYSFVEQEGIIESYWTEEGKMCIKNGKGVLSGFDSLKNVRFEESYEEGKRNGAARYWYPNGQVKEEGFFENNYEQGPWAFYTQEGKVKDYALFDRGMRVKIPAGTSIQPPLMPEHINPETENNKKTPPKNPARRMRDED